MGFRIGIVYEHSEWFLPFFAELDKLNVTYDHLLAHEISFDPAVQQSPYSLIVNRMSPSAGLRGHGNAILFVAEYLSYCSSIGVDVINGREAYATEISKTRQLNILERIGAQYPKARVINHQKQAPMAAEGLRFPVIVKPNIGGSGALIRSFDTIDELRDVSEKETIDLGLDHTALVQEYLPSRDGHIVRVEVLDGEFLYAIKVYPNPGGGFNLCPADICQLENVAADAEEKEVIADYVSGQEKTRLKIEAVEPPKEVLKTVLAIAREAHLDLGGIEYLVNDRNGEIYYYDINALSNFVTDAEQIVGFNPYARLAGYIVRRAGLVQ